MTMGGWRGGEDEDKDKDEDEAEEVEGTGRKVRQGAARVLLARVHSRGR